MRASASSTKCQPISALQIAPPNMIAIGNTQQHDRCEDDAAGGHGATLAVGARARRRCDTACALRCKPQSERGTLMERFVVISADCHAVGRPDDFTPYLEAEYLDAYAESLEQRAEFAEGRAKASEDGGLLFSRETLDEYHGHEETDEVAGGTVGPVGLRATGQGARGRRRRRRSGVPERRPVRHRARRRVVLARAPHRRAARVQPVAGRLLRAGPRAARRHRAAPDPRRRPRGRGDRDARRPRG